MVDTIIRCPGTHRRAVPGDQAVLVADPAPPTTPTAGPAAGRGYPPGARPAATDVPEGRADRRHVARRRIHGLRVHARLDPGRRAPYDLPVHAPLDPGRRVRRGRAVPVRLVPEHRVRRGRAVPVRLVPEHRVPPDLGVRVPLGPADLALPQDPEDRVGDRRGPVKAERRQRLGAKVAGTRGGNGPARHVPRDPGRGLVPAALVAVAQVSNVPIGGPLARQVDRKPVSDDRDP